MLYTSRWNTSDSLEVIHDPSLIRNMAMGGNVWQVRKCLNHQSSENMKPALDKLRTYLVPNILCDIYRVYVLVSDRQNTQRYSSVLWLGLAARPLQEKHAGRPIHVPPSSRVDSESDRFPARSEADPGHVARTLSDPDATAALRTRVSR